MKLDKETLIKEHFWFLLGLVVALALLSLILVTTTTSKAIADVQKTYDDNKKSVERIAGPQSQPKTRPWQDKLEAKRKDVDGKKDDIWDKAWKDQAGLMTWPKMSDEDLAELRKLYFGDPIPVGIRSHFDYTADVENAVKTVQPDVVQFRDGWKSMIRHVDKWVNTPPTAEDVWLAQEDLVVQRGLLEIIRHTNDYLAAFRVVEESDAKHKKESDAKHKLFASSDWALDLTLTAAEGQPALKYQLTNIGGRRQPLDITLQVSFTGAGVAPYLLKVQGYPLAPGQSTDQVQPLPGQVGRPMGLKGVRQIFDWRTVPVKRIDAIALGYPSSRTSGSPLVTGPATPKEEKKDDTTQSVGRSAFNKGSSSDERGTGAGGGLPGRGSSAAKTVNGLEQERYISVSPEVRRMPFGMAVVIDQGHIQEFLTEMANSPLRIQILQWHWSHFHGDIKDPKEQENAGGVAGREDLPAARRPAQVAGPPRGKGGLFPRPGMERETGGTVSVAEERPQWDLVELAVYGITSLYERYPPKSPNAPADNKAAAAPAAPKPPSR
jgi:hypothetical protein